MRLILKPDWDPNNPYHYHVNGQKIVITPEEWEKYKDDPTFREIRAAVEAEQAAYPEPEYDEVENPAWRKAYQNLVNGVNLKGRDNVSQPLPQGYTRDEKSVVIDAQGNYYIPREQASNVPYFINQERGMYGNTVPVRYEQQQMPERTIRQLKQPLPVDRVMNVGKERENAITDYINNESKNIRAVKKESRKLVPLPPSSSESLPYLRIDGIVYTGYNPEKNLLAGGRYVYDIKTGKRYIDGDDWFKKTRDGFKRIDISNWYLADRPNEYIDILPDGSRIKNVKLPVPLDYPQVFVTPDYLINEFNAGNFTAAKNNGSVEKGIFYNGEIYRNVNDYINKYQFETMPQYEDRVIKPSREEAEKKAVVEVGNLEKLGTFAKGGKLIRREYEKVN